MYNVELFDKVNMFSLKKEELFKVLESLEENEEDIAEPILSKEDFENERKRLMALGFVEFN